MRRIAYVFGSLAAAGAGTYLVVYLYRWQWQRAILCGSSKSCCSASCCSPVSPGSRNG